MPQEVFVPNEEEEAEGAVSKSGFAGPADVQRERDEMMAAAEAAVAEFDGESDAVEPAAKKPDAAEKEESPKARAERVNKAPLVAKLEQGDKTSGKKNEDKEDDKEDATPLSKLARDLEKREARREAEKEYTTKIGEAETTLAKARDTARYIDEQKALVDRQRQEMDQMLADLRRNPMTAMKKLGWTPDTFIDNALKEKDPNYQQTVQMQEELRARDAQIDKLTKGLHFLMEKAKAYDEQGEQARAQTEVAQLFESIPKDSPVWEQFEDEDDVLYRANKVRRQYKEKTGRLASPKEIGEYLHYQALKKSKGAPAETAGSKPKAAGKTKANGSRALGNSDASERRSNGKTIRDVETADEERELLIQAADAARESYTDIGD